MKGKLLFIIITIMIIAFTGYLLRVAFVGDPLEELASVQVKDLKLSQEGTSITANWIEMDCSGYEVKIWRDGRLTLIPKIKDNTYTVEGVYPGERYVIKVTAHMKHGLMSRSAKAVLRADRIKQNITVGATDYYGFAGNEFNLKASANGNLQYRSSDRHVAKVDPAGTVKLKNDGEAEITITASENGLYQSGEKIIGVLVYPTVLDKIKGAKTENISSSRALIKWRKNEYASAYTVMRKDPATQQYEVLVENPADVNYLEVTRDDYDYEIKAIAEVDGQIVDGKVSDPVQVRGTTEESSSYSKFKNIQTLRAEQLDLVADIHGVPKARVPQTINMIGDDYVVTYVNMKNTGGSLIAYNKADGSIKSITEANGILGHGNGAAYNPHTNRLYVLSTKNEKNSQWCCVFDGETKEYVDKIAMPVACTAISYDISTDMFYLAKDNVIYVCNSNFKVKKTIRKSVEYFHTQDMGAYNGAALTCTWPQGNESYIDIYRISDGAYLGSYDISIGEIECCTIDDGYLVILMNTIGSNDDKIYRTKERIALP